MTPSVTNTTMIAHADSAIKRSMADCCDSSLSGGTGTM